MEQPKVRLTLQQHQQAINEAIWVDALPHEWPTVDKTWLLCSALIDSVQMVDYLRNRLAAAEAERDAARAKRDAARAEVAHMKREQRAMIMQHRHDIRDLGQLLQDERCKVAAVEAERDAARAGEARAVEALRRCHEGAARQLAEPRDHDDDQYALTAIATDCEAALADSANALDWLAQQRREAAVEALKKLGPLGSSNQELFMVPWGEIKQRIQELEAAALRAGEAI